MTERRGSRLRYVSALGVVTFLAACSGHTKPAEPFQITDHRRGASIQAVKSHDSTLSKIPHALIFVNTSRGSATKQRPFYCDNELIVSTSVVALPDGSYVSIKDVSPEALPSDYD